MKPLELLISVSIVYWAISQLSYPFEEIIFKRKQSTLTYFDVIDKVYLFLLLFIKAACAAAKAWCAASLWIQLRISWAHQTLINAKIQVRRKLSAFRLVHHNTVATISAEKRSSPLKIMVAFYTNKKYDVHHIIWQGKP